MRLLPENQLLHTNRVDHADWNYRLLLGYVMRRRFTLIRDLMPRTPIHRLLEIGFGSGVFMPELAGCCEELYGIDVHTQTDAVTAVLLKNGVTAHLSRQDASNTNFPDGYFDAIVCVSSLEFIDSIDDAAREAARLLNKGGRLIAVMPARSPILDFLLRAATGESAGRDYGNRRERVVPALCEHFRILRTRSFLGIYKAYEFAAASVEGRSSARLA